MELVFEGKETREQILKRISEYSPLDIQAFHSSVIQGDNFDIMASMLNYKKGFVDLVYIDPPYNTNQIFALTKNRANTVSRCKDSQIAYSDLMSEEDFLKFMYERFVLMHELLSEEGSLYVHIDTKMGHYFKVMLDEIFGIKNFKNDITRIKSNPKNFSRKAYGNEKDMILFYSKNAQKNIWNEVKISLDKEEIEQKFSKVDENGRHYTTIPLHAPGETLNGITGMPWRGMMPPEGRHWRTDPSEFDRMDAEGLIEWSKNGNPRIKKYADEHKGKKVQDIWTFKDPQYPLYPTQKNLDMLKLIILQSSREDGIVMDCFAGSGTTLIAAALSNRRFIGMDSSEVAIDVIRKRMALENIAYEEVRI